MIQPVQMLFGFFSTASPYQPDAASIASAATHTHEIR